MSGYWLVDPKGGHLGPVSLGSVRELLAKRRIDARCQVSRDGRHFVPLASLKELADLLAQQAAGGAGAEAQAEAERARAASVRAELERFRQMEVHELFGVPRDASPQAFRAAFLALGKTYHPARLPRNVQPELLHACMAAFTHLQERMAEVEPQAYVAGRVQAPRGQPVSPASAGATAATPPKPAERARWSVTVGQNGRFEAALHLPPGDLRVFLQHPLMNFGSSSLFIETSELLSLGTRLELVVHFAQPAREVKTRAVVVLASAGHLKNQLHGLGLRLDSLGADDKAFIQAQLQGIRKGGEPAVQARPSAR